ncbi:MAG: HAD-IC family P-type ATPase [Candidatus Levybacteria bacterium]|nr:HAD-IC family P-type ATPase [Candidatus Levybacteria bacterium]
MKGLEIARKLDYVVFDKTGTLTKGEFGVADIITSDGASRLPHVANDAQQAQRKSSYQTPSLSERRHQSSKDKQSQNTSAFSSFASGQAPSAIKILQFAAAVETHSQHSIARGIVEEAKKRSASWRIKIPEVRNFKSYPGKGAEGVVEGKRVVVGNEKLIQNLKIKMQNYLSTLSSRPKGKAKVKSFGTEVYVVIDGKMAGMIVLSDIIRDESKEVIQRLHQMKIKTAMLTGDKKDVGESVGKELSIDTVFSEVLPEDKVNKIKELQKQGHIVAMVGDGVNDAPSLTQAHLGIAIGAGTDVAVESAQIVLVKNDPRDVVKAISLSRKTNVKMVQNLLWATGYNVLAIPTAAGLFYKSFGVLLRPEWAAVLMSLSSIIVVFNALLLRREKL